MNSSSRTTTLYLVILYLSFALVHNISAQNFHVGSNQLTLPSYESMALAQYAAVPVGRYTGVPSIQIPLYNLGGKELVVPFTLQYHTSNTQNLIPSGWVGKGWSVSGIGLITRVINGTDDFGTNGYINTTIPTNLNGTTASFINNAAAGTQDTGPDLFYFNFGGYVGKFMFDANGNLVTDPNNQLKVEPLSDQTDEWVIYDSRGYEYTFGGFGAWEHLGFNYNKGDVTAWYLKKIRTPLNELVEFEYDGISEESSGLYDGDGDPDFSEGVFTASGINMTPRKIDFPEQYYIPYLRKVKIKHGDIEEGISFASQKTSAGRFLYQVSRYKVEDGDFRILGKTYLDNSNGALSGVYKFGADGNTLLASSRLIYSTTTKLISKIINGGENKINYFFEPHDYSNETVTGIDGYRIHKIIQEGYDSLYTEFTYTDAQGTSSGQLLKVPHLSFPATKWQKYTGSAFQKVSGTMTSSDLTPLFSSFLGGPMVVYNQVSQHSPQKGKIEYLYEHNNSYITSTANSEGYFRESFSAPMLGLDFRNGKLKKKKTYRLKNSTWELLEHSTYQYEEVSRTALQGINLVFIDAAADKNVVNAASTISSDNASGLTLNYKDITGFYAYSVPTAWSRLTGKVVTSSETPGVTTTANSSLSYVNDTYIRNTIQEIADGTKTKVTLKYPFDYSSELIYGEMLNRQMLNYPLLSLTEQQLPNTSSWELLGGTATEMGFYADADDTNNATNHINENILPLAVYRWEKPKPGQTASSEVPSLSSENFKKEMDYDYDTQGNLVQANGKVTSSSTIYDDNRVRVLATVVNAAKDEIYYNGFETDGTEGISKTGLKSHPSGQFTIPFTPPAGKTYVLSYWYYENNEWRYNEGPFQTQINQGTALDEVRVYPTGARMSTRAYGDNGMVISETDANNISAYYDYSDLLHLTNVRDDKRNIVRTTEHYYAISPPCSESELIPITASFEGAESMVLGVGISHDFVVTATGGCTEDSDEDHLYCKWYVVDSDGNEQSLGITSFDQENGTQTRLSLEPICSEFFTVKCEVRSTYFDDIVTLRKYIQVDLSTANLNFSIKQFSGSTEFRYCPEDGQINAYVEPYGGCGEYTYQWTYSGDFGEFNDYPLEESEVHLPFLGSGSLTCTVTDGFGNTRTKVQSILLSPDCL